MVVIATQHEGILHKICISGTSTPEKRKSYVCLYIGTHEQYNCDPAQGKGAPLPSKSCCPTF